ncbi:MAG: anaerobic ribonucleoside-triphosphate reductase activating protein [Lachnotalea sp.]
MQIHGLNKTTLLDYPGHLASTIFLGNCNFRCPFCHNKGLVLSPDSEPTISTDLIFDHLKKRRNMIEGVCITGGEPTLALDLLDFISQIKDLGFLVKLDTNGYRPDVLDSLLSNHLLDYIAMDIKSSPDNYHNLAGLNNIDINKITTSINIIMGSNIDYEFRTTLVKELHNMGDIEAIGNWIKGCDAYYLQSYKEGEQVINPIYTSFCKEELLHFQKHLLINIKNVQIRGID